MKNVKRIIAAMLLVVIAFTCTACHKKGEIAVTAKDLEFTSAYYMCALVNAYSTAQNEVYNTLTEEEKSATEIDYFSKKIDDKSFETWVKDEALNHIKEIAAYKLLCKENDVTIPEDELAEIDAVAKEFVEANADVLDEIGTSEEAVAEFLSLYKYEMKMTEAQTKNKKIS